MKFSDFNLKLTIINELLERSSFSDELNFLRNKKEYEDAYLGFSEEFGYDKPILEIQEFLRHIELTDADLAGVKSLTFDGGNEIYHIIIPFWDGEDGCFDVVSIDGFENLKNLQKIINIGMIDDAEIARFRSAGIIIL